MDFLYLLKMQHDNVRSRGLSLLAVTTPAEFRSALTELNAAVMRLFEIETDLLFPESEELFPGAGLIIDKAIKSQDKITRLFGKLVKSPSPKGDQIANLTDAQALVSAIDSHLSDQQELLIPKLRKLIPTPDREELGQVLLDLHEDSPSRKLG